VAAIANSFIIREIDSNSDNFMHSANMYEVAERNGHWSKSSGKKLDFLYAFAPMRSHPEYSTRRVWRVLSSVAPSLNLPGDTDAYANDYPFSVKAERVLTPEDLMALNRDHYEGTPYDMTKGIGAGPFGDPTRFDMSLQHNMTMMTLLSGGYERYGCVKVLLPAIVTSSSSFFFI
jgi:dipeptidase